VVSAEEAQLQEKVVLEEEVLRRRFFRQSSKTF
jgi:hypothetical protein